MLPMQGSIKKNIAYVRKPTFKNKTTKTNAYSRDNRSHFGNYFKTTTNIVEEMSRYLF